MALGSIIAYSMFSALTCSPGRMSAWEARTVGSMMAPVYKSRFASIMVLSRSLTFSISSSAVINLVRLATLRCSSAFCSNTTMPVSRLTK